MKEVRVRSKDVVIFNVKYYREKQKISQEELSEKIGKKDYFIKNLEDGVYSKAINVDNIDKIAKALNVPISELFNSERYLKQSDTK